MHLSINLGIYFYVSLCSSCLPPWLSLTLSDKACLVVLDDAGPTKTLRLGDWRSVVRGGFYRAQPELVSDIAVNLDFLGDDYHLGCPDLDSLTQHWSGTHRKGRWKGFELAKDLHMVLNNPPPPLLKKPPPLQRSGPPPVPLTKHTFLRTLPLFLRILPLFLRTLFLFLRASMHLPDSHRVSLN